MSLIKNPLEAINNSHDEGLKIDIILWCNWRKSASLSYCRICWVQQASTMTIIKISFFKYPAPLAVTALPLFPPYFSRPWLYYTIERVQREKEINHSHKSPISSFYSLRSIVLLRVSHLIDQSAAKFSWISHWSHLWLLPQRHTKYNYRIVKSSCSHLNCALSRITNQN